jgi:ornithine cyclodeaminase/alanine dehydrogenase-like protein (mu-crystallin family)
MRVHHSHIPHPHSKASQFMLILSRHDVEAVLDVRTCMAAMEAALGGLSRGIWRQPPRAQVRIDGTGILTGLMLAFRDEGERVLALKDILLVPDNRARGLQTHQGAVLLHDGESGCLLALVDATAVTAIRTAAVSAVATRVLARPDATKVAILGTGVQARRHVEAMRTILPAAEIVVWGRAPDRAAALCEQMGTRACSSVEEAVAGAGVICTVTASPVPLLGLATVVPDCHVNAIGASSPDTREIAADLVAKAALFVDSRTQADAECGEYLLAIRDGAIGPNHIRAELGDVLLGRAPGRAGKGLRCSSRLVLPLRTSPRRRRP